MFAVSQVTLPTTLFRTGAPVLRLRLLLGWIAALLVSVECTTHVFHQHRRVTLSMESGIQDAIAIGPIPGKQQILFVGNSLIYEGVSRQAMQQAMGDTYLVHTAGIPGSTYVDWRYGLHSLFQRGSQPDVVVLGISPSQFLRATVTTPLPISQLWRIQEILAYCRQENTGLSTLSELLLEHTSQFFYMRDTMRIYFRKFIPGYESMVNDWTRAVPSNPAGEMSAAASEKLLGERLVALRDSCLRPSKLVLILVPTNQPEDEAQESTLKSTAARAGIAVIEPIRERQWPVSKFQRDEYHLTPAAAEEFSRLAGTDLANLIDAQDRISR